MRAVFKPRDAAVFCGENNVSAMIKQSNQAVVLPTNIHGEQRGIDTVDFWVDSRDNNVVIKIHQTLLVVLFKYNPLFFPVKTVPTDRVFARKKHFAGSVDQTVSRSVFITNHHFIRLSPGIDGAVLGGEQFFSAAIHDFGNGSAKPLIVYFNVEGTIFIESYIKKLGFKQYLLGF